MSLMFEDAQPLSDLLLLITKSHHWYVKQVPKESNQQDKSTRTVIK